LTKLSREAKASATEAALNGLYVAPMTLPEGDPLVDGILITPWPASTVRTEQQKEMTGKVLDLLITQALEKADDAKDGAWHVGRCVVSLPNYACNTPVWNWWTAFDPRLKQQMLESALERLVFRWRCSGTLEDLEINIGEEEAAEEPVPASGCSSATVQGDWRSPL
jgi:hypothetical protein